MPRKPTIEDALLLALQEASEDGLSITNWYIMKPGKFQESYDDFIKIKNKLEMEKLIEFNVSQDVYKLTKEGTERAKSIEDEINRDDYISLITCFSPKEELRKRTLNIETLIVSLFFGLLSALGLENRETIHLPSFFYLLALIFLLIVFVIGLRYSISSFMQIVQFWAYYSIKHGKTANQIIIFSVIFYREHKKYINGISRYIGLPLIILLITVHFLGWSIQNSIGTLIIAIFTPYMLPKSKS